jgi:peptide/nickel transport system substrate-binding protein
MRRFTLKSKFQRAGAILLVGSTMLVSMGANNTLASPARAGGTLTIGWAEPPDTLNPATTGARDVGPIDVNIFDTLIWLTSDNKVTPDLATSWKISDQGKTYTFTLRQGVKFHDGTPFNADAVVANFKYITSPTTRSTISLALLGSCTLASATAAYTVVVKCATPYAPLLAQLGEPYMGIQSPTAITKYGKALDVHPIGTGPFEFVSYTPNVSIVLKRNPDYNWAPPALKHNGPAALDQLVFHIVVTSQARVSELQSGQSQFIQETPGVFYKVFGKNPSFQVMGAPISGMGIWSPINAQAWPTNSLAVRQAILYSVDKVGAIKVADDGVFPPSWGPLQPGTYGYDPRFNNMYNYNPQKAAQLLTGDGWKKVGGFWTKGGKRLTLDISAISSVPEYPLISQAIQGYLRQAGMDASVTQLAVPAWLASNIKGTMNLAPLQYIAVDPDALHLWYLPKQYYNWSHYTNPTLTNLINQGQVEQNQAKRLKIYSQAQKMIMDQALEMPIHQNIDLLVMSSKLHGVTYSGGGFEYFYPASLQ